MNDEILENKAKALPKKKFAFARKGGAKKAQKTEETKEESS